MFCRTFTAIVGLWSSIKWVFRDGVIMRPRWLRRMNISGNDSFKPTVWNATGDIKFFRAVYEKILLYLFVDIVSRLGLGS